MQKKILKDCEATICSNKHYMIQCSSLGPCQLCYLSAAGQAVSWFQCPATLQPGSWADYQYCWLPAGGSAGSERADTTLGISVKRNHLYGDLWWPFAQRLIIYKWKSHRAGGGTCLTLHTFELVLRPSVAVPCCSGDAEPDLGWWRDRPESLSSLERKTCGRKSITISHHMLRQVYDEVRIPPWMSCDPLQENTG